MTLTLGDVDRLSFAQSAHGTSNATVDAKVLAYYLGHDQSRYAHSGKHTVLSGLQRER